MALANAAANAFDKLDLTGDEATGAIAALFLTTEVLLADKPSVDRRRPGRRLPPATASSS